MSVKEKVKYDMCGAQEELKIYPGLGVRHVQIFLMFACLSVGYIMRVNMSIAVIAMTDTKDPPLGVKVYSWDEKIQGAVLSAFFWGYTITQIPAGQIAHRYGVKPLIAFALIINGLLTLSLPFLVSIGGWKAACIVRFIQGLTQSSFFPCIHTFISVWIPHSERSRYSNFIFSGTPLGTILGLALSSLLTSTSLGWPCIFYGIGSLALAMGFVWIYLGANSPAAHTSISDQERFYIQSALGQIEKKKPFKTPWRSICTSLPVFAILIAHIGCNWGFTTLFTNIPKYMNYILGIDVKNSGILTILPFAAMWAASIVFSVISDYIVNKKICSPTVSRKVFNSIGTWGPAVGLLMLSYLPPGHEVWAVFLITITVGLGSGMNLGFMMNFVDLSPNFAGTIISMTNCLSNLIASIAPLTVSHIAYDQYDPIKWRYVFFISIAFYFVSNLIFIIWGSTKRQPWNEPNVFGDVEMLNVQDVSKAQIEKEKMLSTTEKKENDTENKA